jgi:pyridinium-3,5-biscarboxylic acid mononucleotide sulfurtransferase
LCSGNIPALFIFFNDTLSIHPWSTYTASTKPVVVFRLVHRRNASIPLHDIMTTRLSVRLWGFQLRAVRYLPSMVVNTAERPRWEIQRGCYFFYSCTRRRTITFSSTTVTTSVREDTTAPSIVEKRTKDLDNGAKSLDDENGVLFRSTTHQGRKTLKKDLTKLVDDLLQSTVAIFTRNVEKHDAAKDDTIPSLASSSSLSHSSSYSKTDCTPNLSYPSRHHIIAFSGGIDSSLVTALIHRVHQQQINTSTTAHQVTAVLGLSPAVPHQQRILAEQVAAHIGVDFETVLTTEGDDDIYQANDGRACLACKTHLYTCLNSIAQQYMVHKANKHGHHHPHHRSQRKQTQLYNGTNADDVRDTTRIGLIAAHNFDVQSPLQYTPKDLVRLVGKHLGLPNWDYASSPCLRSRLAYGVPAIRDHLQTIERAETFVRQAMFPRLKPSHNLRVRLLSGHRAMIEVDEEWVDHVRECLQGDSTTCTTATSTTSSWRTMLVDTLGFRDVNVRPFKTGSVSTTLAGTTLSSSGP